MGEVQPIENVLGGAADDILVGDDDAIRLRGGGGSDTLVDSGGRDLLLGGFSADLLLGGMEEDLLICGSITLDADARRLSPLSSEWASPTRGYASRINSLR